MIGGSASLCFGAASLDMEQTFCKVAAIEETVQRLPGDERWEGGLGIFIRARNAPFGSRRCAEMMAFGLAESAFVR
jgi:hypothetical protein